MKFFSISFLFLFVLKLGFAQPNLPVNGDLFIDSEVPRVDIIIDENALDQIYTNVWSNFEHPATFIFSSSTTTDTVENIGFRLRGNTSRNAFKKSFKVSFNTFDNGQKYKGLEKLNLNGNHNDPTLIRPKLCFDILNRLDLPASRCNFIELYINNDYYGLYTNVEHIDEEFLQSRFKNKAGNLYKCTWPADLNILGSNVEDYDVPQYELKTNETENDRFDLFEFILTLNNTPANGLPCALEPIFNIQDYLKYMAFDVMVGNWDGPLFNKNNFFLYKNPSDGRFEYIPYDLDNTFGIDWVNEDWGNKNIFNWYDGNDDRPLYEKIIQAPEFRAQFNQYVQDIAALFLSTDFQNKYSVEIKTMLEPYATADFYRTLDYGYSLADFQNAFTQALAGGSFHDDQYGIIDFMIERANSALAQVENTDALPYFNYLTWDGGYLNDSLVTTIKWYGDQNNTIKLNLNNSLTNEAINLEDSGIYPDEIAGDSIYTYALAINENIEFVELEYEVFENINEPAILSHPNCGLPKVISFEPSNINLVINEYMASNNNAYADEAGEYDDWFEIYNAGNNSVNLNNVLITDNFKHPYKFRLPNQILVPGEFVVIWADEDQDQGNFHCNFKLKATGEEIGIFEKVEEQYLAIDLLRYENAATDLSYGYFPDDGVGDVGELPFISPNLPNSKIVGYNEIEETDIVVYPNPFVDYILIDKKNENDKINIYNIQGIKVYSGTESIINLEHLNFGTYLLKLNENEPVKLLKLK